MSNLDLDQLEEIMKEVLEGVEEAEPKVVEPEGPIVYLEGTEWSDYSDFQGVEFRMRDARQVFDNDKVPGVLIKEFRGFTDNIIPEFNVYIPHNESLSTIIKSEVTGLKCILVGDTGCGKTSLLEYYASKTGRPFFRIAWDESVDDQKLYGSLEIRATDKGPETYFNAAATTRSMAFPAICVQDELSRGDAGQTMLLNPLLDRGEVTIVSHDEKSSHTVKAVDDWLIFATDNTAGNGDDIDIYNSANVLDQAIINRFDLYQRHPYAPSEVEEKIISALNPKMDSKDVVRLAHFSELCHKGFEERTLTTAFSIRNLIAICDLHLRVDESVKDAIKINYYNRVAKSEQPDVAEMVRSIWG